VRYASRVVITPSDTTRMMNSGRTKSGAANVGAVTRMAAVYAISAAAAVHRTPRTLHRIAAQTRRKVSIAKNGLAAPCSATMRTVNAARSYR
jgi:hypothetical protein